jgi:pimeloyl-ACP methyl ester carboxylesterase
MRCVVTLLSLIALLLPATGASAETICQTPNGSRGQSAIGAELSAAGYPGPWDLNSMAAAYGRATGGAVDCGGTQQVPATTAGVVLVPGVNTYSGSLTFARLTQALHSRGFSDADVWGYSYAGAANSYTWLDTCQDLDMSEARLHDELLGIRASRGPAYSVSLVGHSLGGVVALETAIHYPDVQSMIRSVVTVDSPLLGVSSFKEHQWLAWFGLDYCVSMDELVLRSQSKPQTNAWLRAGAQRLLDGGIWVNTLINDSDWLFTGATADQGINGVNVNVEDSWVDSGSNHSAVLNTPSGLQAILNAIP